MLKKILIGVAVVLVLFVVVVALQPSQYRVVRTATIPATPSVVFDQVNDLHKWDAWSPWAKLDPAMKTTFEGPQSGPGAAYSWVATAKLVREKCRLRTAARMNWCV